MKKRFILITSIVLIVALSLTFVSCNKEDDTGTTKDGKVKFKLLHSWASENDGNTEAFKIVLDKFKTQFPDVELEVDGVTAEYQQKLKTLMASDQVPDIFMTWGAGFSQPFVEGGKILQLDKYLEGSVKDEIGTGNLNNLTYDGKVYGLPTSLAIGVFYCNQELFDKNNVKIPETYAELLTAVDAFNAAKITPMIAGGKDRWPSMFYYDILAIREGGTEKCRKALNKEGSFEDQEFKDAADKILELVDRKAFNSDALGLSWDEAVATFTQGKAAMLFNGTWVSAVCEKDDSLVKGKIVAKKFPIIEGAAGKDTEYFGGALDCLMISSKVKNPDKAFEATKFMTKQMAEEAFKTGSGLPAWKIGDVDTSGINPLVVQQAELIKDATDYLSWWDTYLGGTDAEVHLNLVQELFAKQKTADEYAKAMQELNKK